MPSSSSAAARPKKRGGKRGKDKKADRLDAWWPSLARTPFIGGRNYGNWPGLTNSADADLTVTTDYRSVLGEIVRTRFAADATRVFPGFTGTLLGLLSPRPT